MRIDKVQPFYTDEDRAALAEIDLQIDRVNDEISSLRGEIEGTESESDRRFYYDSIFGLTNKLSEIISNREQVLGAIEQRYIESFKGDTLAILEDVNEIVTATEKEEYTAAQRKTTERLKTILLLKPEKGASREERQAYRASKALAVRGFENCYYFILARVRVQLNALEYYQDEKGIKTALSMVEQKAESYYTRPKGADTAQKRQRPAVLQTQEAATRGNLLSLPSGPAIALLYDVLGGGDLEEKATKKRQYNHNIALEIYEKGDRRRISYSKQETQVSIEIDDIKKVLDRMPQAEKILTKILIEINDQALINGALVKDEVKIPLTEFVGEGQYKNIDTARNGFYKAADRFVGAKVSGKMEHGKNKTITQGRHEVLFTGAQVNLSTASVFLNPRINWQFVIPFFSALPDFYFELQDRPAALLKYIFYLARQNTRKIEEQGHFNISFRAIHYLFGLPNPATTKNPKRDIKDAIEDAIDQIEEKYCKYAAPIPKNATGEKAVPDFALLPVADSTAPIQEYLDKGYLQVSLKGEYARRFIEISKKTTYSIKAAEAKRARIEEKAAAIRKAKEEK